MSELKSYVLVLFVTIAIAIFQIVGAILSGSLALLADTIHVASDGLATIVAIVAVIISSLYQKKETRVRKIGVFINGGLLVLSALWIIMHAYERYLSPNNVYGGIMLSFAMIGGIGNYIQHIILHKTHSKNSTLEMLDMHILADLLSSIGVVLAGTLIWLTGWKIIDVLLSVILSTWILWQGIKIVFKQESTCHHNHHNH